jgi:hypothetical protein
MKIGMCPQISIKSPVSILTKILSTVLELFDAYAYTNVVTSWNLRRVANAPNTNGTWIMI